MVLLAVLKLGGVPDAMHNDTGGGDGGEDWGSGWHPSLQTFSLTTGSSPVNIILINLCC